jgi:hypothetical protein
MPTFPIFTNADAMFTYCYFTSAMFTTLEVIGLAILFWPDIKERCKKR